MRVVRGKLRPALGGGARGGGQGRQKGGKKWQGKRVTKEDERREFLSQATLNVPNEEANLYEELLCRHHARDSMYSFVRIQLHSPRDSLYSSIRLQLRSPRQGEQGGKGLEQEGQGGQGRGRVVLCFNETVPRKM